MLYSAEKKNDKLLVAFSTFGWISCIFWCLDIRPDMRHREALVFLAGAGGTFPEVLLTFVEGKFLSTINAHIFSRADFLPRGIRLLFSQLIHQNFHARQRYIWIAFVHHKIRKGVKKQIIFIRQKYIAYFF